MIKKLNASTICLYSKDGKKKLQEFKFGEGEKYETEDEAKEAAQKREGQVQTFKKKGKTTTTSSSASSSMYEDDPEEEPENGEREAEDTVELPVQDEEDVADGEEDAEEDVEEAYSYGEQEELIREAFSSAYPYNYNGMDSYKTNPRIVSVYPDFVLAAVGAKKYRVDYTMTENGEVTLQPRNEWKQARLEVVTTEESDTDEDYIFIGEVNVPELVTLSEDKMEADVVVIEPGKGNRRDNHYYSKELVRKIAPKLQGVKMYQTTHKEEGHKDVRNWVATIKESGKRFTPTGGVIARVAIHNNEFWSSLKNLKNHGLLKEMRASILATGLARRGVMDGSPVKIVEDVTNFKSVDFVPKDGAGGHVVSLIEQYQEEGHVDFITLELLTEMRPDLVDKIEAPIYSQLEESEEKLFNLRTQYNAMKAHTQRKEVKIMGKVNPQANVNLEETEVPEGYITVAEYDEAMDKLAESKQKNMKLEAVNYLLTECEAAKELPQVAVIRVKKTIMEDGYFEEGADTKKEVDALVTSEQEYVKSLVPEKSNQKPAKVTEMGESHQEIIGEKPSREQQNEAVDTILAEYGIQSAKLNPNGTRKEDK